MLLPGHTAIRQIGAIAITVALLTVTGCSGNKARVTGKVSCDSKPVIGVILFTPKGENEANKGSAVTGKLREDGGYDVSLMTVGKHTIVITPSDLRYPVKKGEADYPCSRSPQEREIQAGDNALDIEMSKRK